MKVLEHDMDRLLRYSLFAGLGAAVASTAAIMILARAERKPVWRPINATSHWLWGDEAGLREEADWAHTAPGLLTNHAAALFWGSIFGAFLATRPPRQPMQMLRDASAVGLLATIVDYGLVPRRLTPGWELALSRGSVAASLGAMSLGLWAGGMVAREAELGPQQQALPHA